MLYWKAIIYALVNGKIYNWCNLINNLHNYSTQTIYTKSRTSNFCLSQETTLLHQNVQFKNCTKNCFDLYIRNCNNEQHKLREESYCHRFNWINVLMNFCLLLSTYTVKQYIILDPFLHITIYVSFSVIYPATWIRYHNMSASFFKDFK